MRRSIWVTGMLCFFAGSVMADQVTAQEWRPADRNNRQIGWQDTAHQNGVRGRSERAIGRRERHGVLPAVAPGFEGWTDDRRDSDSRGQ